MTEPNEDLQELDAEIGKRFLVIEVNDDGIEWDDEAFAPAEILWIAEVLRADALEYAKPDEDDDDA